MYIRYFGRTFAPCLYGNTVIMKTRNPYRKTTLYDLLDRFDRFVDPYGDGRFYVIICVIFLSVMLWLCAPILIEEEQTKSRVNHNEYLDYYFRE